MIDPVALREALINVIVHNDYTREVTPVVEIFADHLSITSYGRLVSGLSRKEFLAGRSMPRNREIMRVFRDLGLVEHLGSGMSRILSHYPADIFSFSEHFLEVSFPFAQGYFDSPEAQTYPVTEVTTEVKKLLFSYSQPASKKTLMAQLNHHNDEHFRKTYLVPAIKVGLLEMTLPDKPKSWLQQYRLTEKGERVKRQLAGVRDAG